MTVAITPVTIYDVVDSVLTLRPPVEWEAWVRYTDGGPPFVLSLFKTTPGYHLYTPGLAAAFPTFAEAAIFIQANYKDA